MITYDLEKTVRIPAGQVMLEGSLEVPADPQGMVVFAHGSGSSRLSIRNVFVAHQLREGNLATLLFDLLTEAEDTIQYNRFDIDLLASRLVVATRWLKEQPEVQDLPIGYFGASTGAAAALKAAASLGETISAVVSRGGRPDLAEDALPRVTAPTLLIVGGEDRVVLDLNRQAYEKLTAPKRLVTVPGATHLFEEAGTLEEVARAARDWFLQNLLPPPNPTVEQTGRFERC